MLSVESQMLICLSTALGNAISRLNLNNLTELSIGYPRCATRIINHSFSPGCVLDTQSPPVDLACRSINRICQLAPIRELSLGHYFILPTDLFARTPGQGASWPHMETIRITLAGVLTANGGWLIKGDGMESLTLRSGNYYRQPRMDRLRRQALYEPLEGLPSLLIQCYHHGGELGVADHGGWKVPEDVVAGCSKWMAEKGGVFKGPRQWLAI